MDTELADRLTDLKVGLSAISSKCEAIHESQEDLKGALRSHENRDREDFKEVHDRITRVDRKQSWMLGVATVVLAFTVAAFKGLFGG